MSESGDFLAFRKFITPVLIQIIFWVGVVFCVISGIVAMTRGGVEGVAIGLLLIAIGPLIVRLYCEILILLFRIYDNLVDIRNNTAKTA